MPDVDGRYPSFAAIEAQAARDFDDAMAAAEPDIRARANALAAVARSTGIQRDCKVMVDHPYQEGGSGIDPRCGGCDEPLTRWEDWCLHIAQLIN